MKQKSVPHLTLVSHQSINIICIDNWLHTEHTFPRPNTNY